MYSSAFGISLIGMNLITTLVILAVSSNLITSLGMVGALSIVRFRTVVKEPLDLVYLFWSITAGIIVGVGLIPLVLLGSLVIGAILYIFTNKKTTDTPTSWSWTWRMRGRKPLSWPSSSRQPENRWSSPRPSPRISLN